MTREFSDELLSAFLDGELSPAEHEQVERHLAANTADAQLLAELKSLRSEVAALPPAAVSPDFTDRVVRAAVAEAEKYNPATAATSLPPPAVSRRRRIWVGAAVASAAALAACLLLVVQTWRKSDSPDVKVVWKSVEGGAESVAESSLVHTLRTAVPADGEAVVLRLRVAKDLPIADALNAAMEKAGLAPLGATIPTGAAAIAAVYGKTLEATYGPGVQGAENNALLDGTVAAAHALFIEAPLEQLEAVVRNVADNMKHPLQLDAQTKLAFTRPKIEFGEGEYSPAAKTAKAIASGQPFAQQLDAARFRLEKKLAQAANAAAQTPPATPDPKKIVRVLLLVEAQ